MATAVESFLNVLLLYFIAMSVFRLFALVRAKNAVKNLKEQKQTIENSVPAPEEIEMVTDIICGSTIPRAKAYILARGDQEHYFCSWDCRNKFIADEQGNRVPV